MANLLTKPPRRSSSFEWGDKPRSNCVVPPILILTLRKAKDFIAYCMLQRRIGQLCRCKEKASSVRSSDLEALSGQNQEVTVHLS
ncbi:hypothetical protein Tco_0303444 [Tanacetum coccineum]